VEALGDPQGQCSVAAQKGRRCHRGRQSQWCPVSCPRALFFSKASFSLTYVRIVHWNYRKSMRCRPRTSIQYSVHTQGDTEKASTRCQNGQEYATRLAFEHKDSSIFFRPAHTQDKSKRLLIFWCILMN